MENRVLTFGEQLAIWLDNRGKTQADLARDVGTSTSVVSYWVRNLRRPRPESCYRIAEALDLDPEVVLYAAGHLTSLPRNPSDYERLRELGNVKLILERIEREEVEPGLSVRFYGRVPADSFRWERATSAEGEEYVRVLTDYVGTRSLSDLFVVQASGDCLQALGITDGDYVLCTKLYGRPPKDRDIVVARIGDEYSLQQFFRMGDWLQLRDGDGHVVYEVSIVNADELDIEGVKLYRWESPRNDESAH